MGRSFTVSTSKCSFYAFCLICWILKFFILIQIDPHKSACKEPQVHSKIRITLQRWDLFIVLFCLIYLWNNRLFRVPALCENFRGQTLWDFPRFKRFCLISTTIRGFYAQMSVIVHQRWKSQPDYNCVPHFS